MSILENIRKEKVEWKRLGDVCEFITTGKLNANAMCENGKYPFSLAVKSLFYIDNYAFDMDAILISGNGSQVGHINRYNGKFNTYQRTYVIGMVIENVSIDYLYYYLMTFLKEYILKNAKKGSIPYITLPMLQNFKIPIPSIETQTKIVEILDKFTEYISALNEELTLRVKQYEYYRDMLLSEEFLAKKTRELCGQGALLEFKSLGEVCSCYDGTHQTPKYVENGVPFVSVQNIKNIYGTNKFITFDDYNKYKIKPQKNDLFMTRIGDIGTCALVENDDDLAYYVTLALLRPNQEIILSKFLKYLIESNQGKKELDKRTLHTANPIKINLSEIPKIELTIPPLKVQEYIVDILDKFDTLANDLKEGLPREIELRGKQYEYYREKLFSYEGRNE